MSEDEIQQEIIDRLRGQLQNCVNHLEKAKRGCAKRNAFDGAIDSANRALYETLNK